MLKRNGMIAKMVECLAVEAAENLSRVWTEAIGRSNIPVFEMYLVDDPSLSNRQLTTLRYTDWHTIPLYQSLLTLVAQASIRVFLGPELCRNQRWIEINTQFTMVAIGAVKDLRKYPRSLVNFLHWFHPGARATRTLMKEARSIFMPIYQEKIREFNARRKAEESSGTGKAQPATDALGWFEEMSKGKPYDPTVAQLTFAVAAIHATTDLLCQTILDLSRRPEVITALRKELLEVLSAEGWTQLAFSKLRLMDSVMKESQRLKPVSRGKTSLCLHWIAPQQESPKRFAFAGFLTFKL